MTRSAAFFAACLAATPAIGAAPENDAKAFVENLYQSYSHADAGPVLGRRASTIFAPKLLAEIRADQQRHPGEVGKLDHDPICDCQDSDGLQPVAVSVTDLPESQAEATVRVKLGNAVKVLHLRLVSTQTGWRIADVTTPGMPSLQAFLATP